MAETKVEHKVDALPREDAEKAVPGEKEINRLFRLMLKHNASDLHFKVGMPPLFRVSGDIRPLSGKPMTQQEVERLLYDILTPEQVAHFEKGGNLDLAYGVIGVGRFRINLFRQRGNTSMAARRVKTEIPDFKGLNLPPVLEKIAQFEQGLVIVAGITGSGKSTTLASAIDYINQRFRYHIITIEDPIEYLHNDKKSFINQREVGVDIASFMEALRYVVREDPDVILIGEMRDPETFQTGLTAAETGHLVFGTLHSSSVAQTFGRILDLFPSDRHDQIRQSLRFNLKAVICQKLLPSIKPGVGVVPSCEIMISNPTIQKLIREKRDEKIADAVRGGRLEGMQDFNQSLSDLVNKGLISREVALATSPNPDQLEMQLQGIVIADEGRILGGGA